MPIKTLGEHIPKHERWRIKSVVMTRPGLPPVISTGGAHFDDPILDRKIWQAPYKEIKHDKLRRDTKYHILLDQGIIYIQIPINRNWELKPIGEIINYQGLTKNQSIKLIDNKSSISMIFDELIENGSDPSDPTTFKKVLQILKNVI